MNLAKNTLEIKGRYFLIYDLFAGQSLFTIFALTFSFYIFSEVFFHNEIARLLCGLMVASVFTYIFYSPKVIFYANGNIKKGVNTYHISDYTKVVTEYQENGNQEYIRLLLVNKDKNKDNLIINRYPFCVATEPSKINQLKQQITQFNHIEDGGITIKQYETAWGLSKIEDSSNYVYPIPTDNTDIIYLHAWRFTLLWQLFNFLFNILLFLAVFYGLLLMGVLQFAFHIDIQDTIRNYVVLEFLSVVPLSFLLLDNNHWSWGQSVENFLLELHPNGSIIEKHPKAQKNRVIQKIKHMQLHHRKNIYGYEYSTLSIQTADNKTIKHYVSTPYVRHNQQLEQEIGKFCTQNNITLHIKSSCF